MRKFLLLSCLFATTATCLSFGADGKIFPYDYKLITLDNGFKAYFIDTGPSGQIAYVTVVRTGSREEWEPGRSGYAHFFEHMMFRGTDKYPDYSKMTIQLGASRNAFTNNDLTCYYLVTAAGSLETVMDLESDRFRNLNYSEADFKRQAVPVLGEFNQGRANSYGFLFEKLRDTAFDHHTYKHTTVGFEADVRAMPEGFEYSRDFFKRYYRPENCVLLLAGDFDFAKAETLLEKYYGTWETGYVAPEIKPEPDQTAPREASIEFPGRCRPTVCVAYKGPAWSAVDKTAIATEVLGQLAFGQNSDIYRKLVIQDQVAQTFFDSFGLQRDPYVLTITSAVKSPEQLETVKAEIAEVVKRFREQPCDLEQLEKTKKAIRYGFLNSMETAQGVAFSMLDYVVGTGGIEAVEDYHANLAALTPEDIQNAAQKFLVENGKTTITMLPSSGGK